jgi:hypothetical protein
MKETTLNLVGIHLKKPNTGTSMPGMLLLLKLRIGIPSNMNNLIYSEL